MSGGHRLAECTWPPLGARHAAALREATAFVFERFDPIGIIATGTIIRGTAHATSDLDVCVIHRASFRQRVQRYFGDVPAEILVNPPGKIREYFASEFQEGRRIMSHMIATGIVIWAGDPEVSSLQKEAAEWLGRPGELTEEQRIRGRYHGANLLEDGLDVVETDPPTASLFFARAVTSMLELHCHARTGAIPRGKDLLRTMTELDAHLGSIARQFFTATSVGEQRAHAEHLADATIGVRGFFEWDSGPEPLG
jgi:predicted nucleotidyltransferase